MDNELSLYTMATNPKPKFPLEIIFLIIVLMGAIGFTLMAVGPELFAQILRPTPTVIQSTSIPATSYKSEIIPASTDSPDPTQTSTTPPMDTPAPTLTPTLLPTASINRPLPDLTVTGISEPICTPVHIGETEGNFLKFTVVVRNVGHGSTRHFGLFDVGVFVVLGQQHYSLDEWATKFDGVISVPQLKIYNINPNKDISLTLILDLKGNTKFGIEAVANSGANPVPELNTANNTLIKYFSVYCH